MTRAQRADRRRFLKTVGLAGLTSAVVAPALSLAQSPPAKPGTPAPGAAPADTSGAAKPPEISEDARALAGILQRRYGKDLTAEQVESITKDLDGDLKAFKRLRDVKLGNGDEPDFTFRA